MGVKSTATATTVSTRRQGVKQGELESGAGQAFGLPPGSPAMEDRIAVSAWMFLSRW
jgi:hypothetical protein